MLRPWYAVLSDRTAVALSGSDAALVWHNLSTNLAVCGPCHLLNAQGRLLFAAFVGRSEHQQLIVDVDTAVLPQFQRHVAMYALRKDVRLAPLPRMHVVHAEGLGGGGCVDRRFGDAAERRYCETLPDVERNDARYDTLRRLNGISESFAELSLGKAVSLECNLDRQVWWFAPRVLLLTLLSRAGCRLTRDAIWARNSFHALTFLGWCGSASWPSLWRPAMLPSRPPT